MTEVTTLQPDVIRLPPVVPVPRLIQGTAFSISRRWTIRRAARRYGPVFALNVPVFGPTVIVADPALVKKIYLASTDDLINIQPNLSRVLGRGSVFALDRDDHRNRRKLLAPPFHGKSIRNYERIIEEETLRESAKWPESEQFRTLEPMMRITLNVILRAAFGADGPELDYLRQLVPPFVKLGSRLAVLPRPSVDLGPHSPWRRLDQAHREFDTVVATLIDKAEADPRFDDRADILALLLRSRYDDGSAMSRQHIADELTLVGAGHETTAATLAWAFERLSRHPQVLASLVAEAATDGNELRQAAILEVQRARTVIDFSGRHVAVPVFELGEWRIPKGYSVVVSITELHEDSELFPEPQRFDPYRFVGTKPPTAWLPYGGGTRRCVGAAFANTEMDVVLRTVLRHFTIESTNAPAEKVHSRGVAYVPKQGGRVIMHRR